VHERRGLQGHARASSFSEAANENGYSRILIGIQFRRAPRAFFAAAILAPSCRPNA
jgi:hypothetical protein